jgi:hypothetical protein
VSWDLDCGAGVHREVPDRWSTAETDPRGGYLGRLSGSNSAAARSAVLWHGLLAIGNGGPALGCVAHLVLLCPLPLLRRITPVAAGERPWRNYYNRIIVKSDGRSLPPTHTKRMRG